MHAGNSARVASVGCRLKKLGHEVHFIYFDHQSPLTPEQREGMIQQWDSFQYIPFRGGERPDRMGQPWHADDWFQSDIGHYVRSICEVLKPEVVLCNYAFHSKIFDFVNDGAIKVLDTHDVFSNRHLILDRAGLPRRFYFTDIASEAFQLRRADLIVSIQDNEAKFFERIVSKPVLTVGHLTDKVLARRPDNEMPRVGFVASGNHLNRQAIDAYIEAAAENLAVGLYELVIAGTVCEGIADRPGLTKLGRVEDLADFYGSVDLAINPMEHGTGLKIKTVEALQHGVPLISTACGFDGLVSPDRNHCLADAAGVAERVGEVVRRPSALKKLAKASTQIFESYAAAQTDAFDAIFRARASLEEYLGGASEVEDARNQAARKILVATHARFWLNNMGSHLRIRQLVEELCRRYQVLVFVTFRLSAEDISLIAALGLPLEVVGTEKDVRLPADETEDTLLGKVPNEYLFETFKTVAHNYKPSVCIVEYLRLSFLVKALPNHTVRIIDTHDLISRRQESRSRVEVTAKVDRAAEKRALSSYDYVMTIQRTEAAIADRWIGRNNILYTPLLFGGARVDAPRNGKMIRVGFIAANNPANLNAITWFMTRVWPYFSRNAIKLQVAGSIANSINSPVEGVDLLGPVNLDEFYNSIDIAVNPVRWGGGLKIKTVEALSYGVPIVCSPEGAVGLEEAEGRGLAIARSAPRFAHLLNQLIENPELRRDQGEAGRSFIGSEFSRELVFRDLHMVLQSSSPNWPGRASAHRG